MEYEFDKEIDPLLQQARRETDVSTDFKAHIDADEISLFAENALTNKARARVTEHLADCAKCRKILSNVIALNAEESSENLHGEETKATAPEVVIPWYRKLFVFPQLAYTMGGLTVLLAGMIGYVTLQSYNESKSSSIAQMERSVERPRGAGGADSDGESVTMETYSANSASNVAAPAPVSNSAGTTTNTAMNAAGKSNVPVTTANSDTVSIPQKKQVESAETYATPSALVDTTTADAIKTERDAENKEIKNESESLADNAGRAAAPQDYSRNSTVQNQTQIMPDSRNVQTRRVQNLPMARSAPQPIQQSPSVVSADAAKPKSADDRKDSSEKAKKVNGKDFVYRDGAWYDKSYRQQKTINIRRSSDDYKKLDSGLRSIADNLGGTVVIVWKNMAYRIQ